jgi:hypothetical protein
MMSIAIKRHGRSGYKIVTTDIGGRASVFDTFETRESAEKARWWLHRICDADALAVGEVERAIAAVQRAAGVTRPEAIEALRDVVSEP